MLLTRAVVTNRSLKRKKTAWAWKLSRKWHAKQFLQEKVHHIFLLSPSNCDESSSTGAKNWKLHIHMATFAKKKHTQRDNLTWYKLTCLKPRSVSLQGTVAQACKGSKLEDKYERKDDELFYLLFAQQPQDNWFDSTRFHARQWTFLNMEYTHFTKVRAERPLKEQELIFTRWSNQGQSRLRWQFNVSLLLLTGLKNKDKVFESAFCTSPRH